MNPGRLNKRITFQTYRDLENEVGDIIQGLVDLKTVWASVAPIKGREYLEAKKIQAELTYKITTRYFKDITPDMLIKYGERIFNIQDIIDPYESHKELNIMCIEKVKTNG